MKKEKITIENPTGLHLKPAGKLCETAVRFQCEITFRVRNTYANAKSILSVLGACVKCGDEIELECNGVDEEEAMNAIIRLIKNKMGE
jgi:phosphocarrier protein